MNTEVFAPDEAPTTPARKEYVAARVVQLWNASSEKDQKKIMRLLEKCALANQGAVEWSKVN